VSYEDVMAAAAAQWARAESTNMDLYHQLAVVMVLNMANGCLGSFENTGSREDLTAAITLYQQLSDRLPPGAPLRGEVLYKLGHAFGRRFSIFGAAEDLDRGIDALRGALPALPVDDPFRLEAAEKLANAYPLRYRLTEELADLDRFVDARLGIAEALPADDPRRAESLMWCGFAHHARYDHLGRVADLDAAVDWSRRAVAADPDHGFFRLNLARALHTRFLHDTSLENLVPTMPMGWSA
jgi:hypothetical protein